MAIQTKNIIYKLVIDKTGATKDLGDVNKKIKDIENTSKRAAQTERGIAKTAEQASKRRIKNIKDSEKAIKQLRKERERAFDPDRIREFDQAINKTKRDIDSLKGTTNKAGTQMGNFGGIVTKVGGILAATFAVERIGSFISESVKLANQTKNVRNAFNQLDNSVEILRTLKVATSNTVSEFKLLQVAVRADKFKVPLNQLATLFKFATDRAAETGQEVDFLVNSIVDGIGRKSALVLDNLGLSAADIQQEFKKTGDFGQAAANIIERAMAETTVIVDQGALSAARLSAQWEDTKLKIGDSLSGLANQAATDASNILKAFTSLFKELAKLTDLLPDRLTNFRDGLEDDQKALDNFVTFLEALPSDLVTVENEIIGLTKALDTLNKEASAAAKLGLGLDNETLKDVRASIEETESKIAALVVRQQELKREQRLSVTTAEEYKTKLAELNNQLILTEDLFGGTSEQAKTVRENIKLLTASWAALQNQLADEQVVFVTGNLFDLNQQISALTKEQAAANTTLERNDEIVTKLNELNKQRAELLGQVKDKVKELNEESTDAALKAQNQLALILLENSFLEKKLQISNADELIELEKQYQSDRLDLAVKGLEARLALLPIESKEYADLYNQLLTLEDKFLTDLQKNNDDAGPFTIPIEIANAGEVSTPDDFQKIKDEEIAIALATADTIAGIASDLSQYQQALYESDFQALQNQLDRKQISEQQFDVKVAQLKREQARKEKANALFQIAINTAASVAATAAKLGYPAAIPFVALAIAEGAIQAGLVASQPIPQFAEGVIGLQGDGTGTSDSIPAMLSKGESVMTAKETNKHGDMFEAIRNNTFDDFAKHNIIDPVMMGMQIQGHKSEQKRESKFDDYRLFRAIKGNGSVGIKNSDAIGRSVAKHMGNQGRIRARYV